MSNESDETKSRLDKTMGDMKELQRKLDAMTPEQKQAFAKKLKAHEGQMKFLMDKLGQAFGEAKAQKESTPNRVAIRIVEDSQIVSDFRSMKSRRELANSWGQGWLIPIANFSKKASLKQGKGVKSFWAGIMQIVPEQNDTLVALGDAWNKAPALALPALVTQISSLLLDHFGPAVEHRILPFNLTSTIIQRIVIEVQIQAGSDPSDTTELEATLKDLTMVAAGESPSEDLSELTLKGMLAYGWLASILASKKK